jgi:hypothetical protein
MAASRIPKRRRDLLRGEIEEARPPGGDDPADPQVLERHLAGLTDKLRSGSTGRVREAIRASVEKIVVAEDGSLTLDVKPEGLLGAQAAMADSTCRVTGPILERPFGSAMAGTGR